MTVPLRKPGSNVALVEGRPEPMQKHWRQFMDALLLEVHKGITPVKGCVPCYFSSDDVTNEFDANGLGRDGGPYQWWAICNGNSHTVNGTTVTTPDLSTDSPIIKHSNTAAGGTGGDNTTSSISTANSGPIGSSTQATATQTVVQAGVGAVVATSDHIHLVDAHIHTIDHTHETTEPYYELVWIMRLA